MRSHMGSVVHWLRIKHHGAKDLYKYACMMQIGGSGSPDSKRKPGFSNVNKQGN